MVELLYRNYNWCYEQFITQRKSIPQIAQEFGYSARVLEKWITEVFKIHKKEINSAIQLSDMQKSLVIGSILGDGHITQRGHFIEQHSLKQKGYLFWKYDILKNICNNLPAQGMGKKNNFGEGKPFVRLTTKRLNELVNIKQKSVKQLFADLNELSLSVFILDDAGRNGYLWELCLASYAEDEKEFFRKVVYNKFNIQGHYKKDSRYLLYSRDEANAINDIILRNVPNSLDIIYDKILNHRGN